MLHSISTKSEVSLAVKSPFLFLLKNVNGVGAINDINNEIIKIVDQYA